jgi:TatA/E family protein of Tat protein translocase
MFAGLASPSHLIIVLVLLLFGAKGILELAKDLGASINELREGISTGAEAEAKALESEVVRNGTRARSAADETVGARASQRSL